MWQTFLGFRLPHAARVLAWLLVATVPAVAGDETPLPSATKEVVVLALTFDNWLRADYREKKTDFLTLVDKSRVKAMEETIARMRKRDENAGSRLLPPIIDHANRKQLEEEAEDEFKSMTFTETKKDKQYVVKVPYGATVAIIRVKDRLVVSGYEPAP
ncbi:MAG TPA: hypothetical protein VHX44_12465 [Planctomycetota bacterium]|nr:hypothetical protein [Planctomycetota bacterium]